MEYDQLIHSDNTIKKNDNNTKRHYMIVVLIIILIIIQIVCLLYLIQFSNTAKKFKLYSYNETEINNYVNKIELIVDYTCKKLIQC